MVPHQPNIALGYCVKFPRCILNYDAGGLFISYSDNTTICKFRRNIRFNISSPLGSKCAFILSCRLNANRMVNKYFFETSTTFAHVSGLNIPICVYSGGNPNWSDNHLTPPVASLVHVCTIHQNIGALQSYIGATRRLPIDPLPGRFPYEHPHTPRIGDNNKSFHNQRRKLQYYFCTRSERGNTGKFDRSIFPVVPLSIVYP